MKIIVLNGSPKGPTSVTMQYVDFMRKKNPQHDFEIIHIAQQIRQIETSERFNEIIAAIKGADGILWAFPVYICLVHAHYKRFIELISERVAESAFQGKYTALLTTSIHFHDHTAHNYLHGICDDLDMKVYGSFSAGMHDLFNEQERKKLVQFSKGFFDVIDRDAPSSKVYAPLISPAFEYHPGANSAVLDPKGHKVLIVTDVENKQTNLSHMIERVSALLKEQVEVINLHHIDIKGSCLGCIRCGYDNTCCYQGKDGFIDFYNNKIKAADVLIFAGAVHDRYLSSLWKTFFDRAFFNTHIPSLAGKQIAFLISGPLRQLPNLRQIMEAYTQWQQANLVDFVTDEAYDSLAIDQLLDELAQRSLDDANCQYIKPATFLGVGGRKIFRDEIWGKIRFPFATDHRFYKQSGFYDFPQQDYATRIRNLFLSFMIKIPVIRKKIYNKMMITKMIEPYQRLIAKL